MSDQPLGSPDDAGLSPAGGLESHPLRGAIPAEELGSVTLSPAGDFVAGSHQTFTLTYTAGKFGIDDSGSLRICFRFASDQTRPQFENPGGPNYTTIVASNSAVLQYHYDPKGNVVWNSKVSSQKVCRRMPGEPPEVTPKVTVMVSPSRRKPRTTLM